MDFLPPRHLTLPVGFHAAGTACGIKPSGAADLALIAADRSCSAAGVFTRSRTPGAPLAVTRRHLRGGGARAIIINSGNANASTGKPGERDAGRMSRRLAQRLGDSPLAGGATPRPEEVLVASTGIIGHRLPMDRIEQGIAQLVPRLARGDQADADAARAILTTDRMPKAAHRAIELAGRCVQMAGIAKGSGMIAPHMGTLLAFITTDAAVEPGVLQAALREAVAASFNRISIDQHTSPSDMVLALASGGADHPPIRAQADPTTGGGGLFQDTLTDLCRDLAYQVVADGEGATKVLRVHVKAARTEREADRVARAVVNSPLVKTAVHGGDPNWGRVVTAAGYSGVAVQPARMSLRIGAGEQAVRVYEAGVPRELTDHERNQLAAAMRQREVILELAMGRGEAEVQWLGCDLSREYVTINADYTT